MFLLTCLIVGTLLYIGAMYARGYRFDKNAGKLSPRGLLVVKSNPDGAQVYLDGTLKTATNTNLSLAPGGYKLEIKKDGYRTWSKEITIEKEVVTEADAALFKVAPALSPITFFGAGFPVESDDFSKIAFSVPATTENLALDKEGLWIIETINLPIGFSRDPRRIADGDLVKATWSFSPDSRQILLKTLTGTYLLDTGTFTPQVKRVGINLTVDKLLQNWIKERDIRVKSQLKNAPKELAEILTTKATNIFFSPDETKIIYLASADASIPKELIKPIPGASTQTEERDIKKGRTYIYDIKEDRNFMITDKAQTLRWYPTSKQILLTDKDKIVLLDYDGTNKQEVYSGSYSFPFAFPTANADRIIILTNLGASSTTENLYTLILK